MAITYQTLYEGTDGGVSASVVIESGQYATVAMQAAGGPLPSMQIAVERKRGDGTWGRITERSAPAMLAAGQAEVGLGVPGEYRFIVPPSTMVVKLESIR